MKTAIKEIRENIDAIKQFIKSESFNKEAESEADWKAGGIMVCAEWTSERKAWEDEGNLLIISPAAQKISLLIRKTVEVLKGYQEVISERIVLDLLPRSILSFQSQYPDNDCIEDHAAFMFDAVEILLKQAYLDTELNDTIKVGLPEYGENK